ncbi:hypothetical protein K1719_016941 [Acacia pycnantha]|nr:hypothetical protein K1719_016941 [Acacia pycnantha]
MMNPLPPFDDEDSFFQISVLNNRSSLSIETIPEHESFHYPAEKVNNFGIEEVIPKGKGKEKKQNEFSAKTAEDGKRSASDHIDGAVKYIKHLRNKVKQLKEKRDELMKNGHRISVIVHPYKVGVEIMCSYSFREYLFTQSKLLSILIKKGFNVVSCTSIKRDEMFIHTIRLEESDIYGSTTDYSELQRKLTAEILSTEHRETASEPENC